MKLSKTKYLIPSSPRITAKIGFLRQLTMHQKMKNVIKITDRTLIMSRMWLFGDTHGWQWTYKPPPLT